MVSKRKTLEREEIIIYTKNKGILKGVSFFTLYHSQNFGFWSIYDPEIEDCRGDVSSQGSFRKGQVPM